MPPIAQVFALVAAALHVVFFSFESVTFTRPEVWRRFGLETQAQADTVRPMAFNLDDSLMFVAGWERHILAGGPCPPVLSSHHVLGAWDLHRTTTRESRRIGIMTWNGSGRAPALPGSYLDWAAGRRVQCRRKRAAGSGLTRFREVLR